MIKDLILKFFSLLAPSFIIGLGILYLENKLYHTYNLFTIMTLISLFLAYWKKVHLPKSRIKATKKWLQSLENIGFEFSEKEYKGVYKNHNISVSYFRNDNTKLPSLRITIEKMQPIRVNANMNTNYYFDKNAVIAEREISDMRNIFKECISEFNFMISYHD